MHQIHENGKPEQKEYAHQMNNSFHAPIDRLFAYPLDYAKNYFTAVQRRNRQQIEHRKVDAD